MARATISDVPGCAGCALQITGHPAASAEAVSPPATEYASGKLLAPNTATGPRGHVHAAHIGFRDGRTIRDGPFDAGVHPGSFPDHGGEKPQLIHRPAPFAPNPARRKARFPAGPFDQRLAKVLDLRGNAFQKSRPMGRFRRCIGLERGLGRPRGGVHVGGARLAKHRIKRGPLDRIPGPEAFRLLSGYPTCNKMFAV